MSVNDYDYGDQVKVSCAFTDAAAAAADPTAVTFKYKTPAGTVATWVYGVDSQVVKDSVGNYHVLLTLNQEGTWYVRWEGTGAVVAADEGELYVADSAFY